MNMEISLLCSSSCGSCGGICDQF